MSTASPVVETVSRKRVVPAAELEKEKTGRTTPEFWEFIETMNPDMWASDYILYILREDPKPSLYGGTNTLEKCPGYIVMADGTKELLSSREDIELAIKRKYGGKAFRLILKKGSERVCEGKCVNEAQPKFPDATMQGYAHPLPSAAQQSDANAIASKAIDTVANQPQEVMNIAINALRASAELIAKSAAPPPAPATENDLDRALRQAMIAKLLAPPADPVETFLRIKQALGDGGGGNTNALADKILTSAVDRFMNPVAASTGKTTLLDLGREVIPLVATTARDAVHEWRLGVEAQVRGVELSRGMNPQPAAQPANAPAAPAIDAPPQATAQPAAQPNAPSGEPPFDWLAIKIVEILKENSYTIDEAVDETLSFLYRAHAAIVPQLLDPPKLNPQLAAGEQGLLQLFQHHQMLKQIPVNPRLVEFIKKFIAAAKEAELQRTAGAAPAAAAPPASKGATP
jgi:hypothetical protein